MLGDDDRLLSVAELCHPAEVEQELAGSATLVPMVGGTLRVGGKGALYGLGPVDGGAWMLT